MTIQELKELEAEFNREIEPNIPWRFIQFDRFKESGTGIVSGPHQSVIDCSDKESGPITEDTARFLIRLVNGFPELLRFIKENAHVSDKPD